MTVRALTLLTRKAGTTVEEFNDYWRNVHAPIAVRFPNLVSYKQHLTVGTVTRGDVPAPEADVDGISELTFDSREDLEAALAGDVAREAADDAANFMDRMRMYIVETSVVVLDGQVHLPAGSRRG